MSLYVAFRKNTGVYHIVVLAQTETENDKALCGKDLFTRNKESI
jgi:hypothetical protein